MLSVFKYKLPFKTLEFSLKLRLTSSISHAPSSSSSQLQDIELPELFDISDRHKSFAIVPLILIK